jgi:hypothetical protein
MSNEVETCCQVIAYSDDDDDDGNNNNNNNNNNAIGMIKSRRIRWAGHVEGIRGIGMHIGFWCEI